MLLLEHLSAAALGGALYVGVELAYRGRSHGSMFLLGGACFFLVGMLDRAAPGLPLAAQAVLGAAVITALELLTGLVVNVGLGLAVWDYGALPMNFRGQICLGYSLLWVPLALAAVFLDDLWRLAIFARPLPLYCWL